MGNVPKLRFKSFNDCWSKVMVGDIYEFKNGLNKGKEYFGQGTPIVNFKDVFNNRGLTKSEIKGKVTLTEKELENYNVKKGDLFFTRTSEIIDEIGYPSVMLEDMVDCVFSGFVLRARAKNPKYDLNHLFKKYVFFTPYFRKEMIRKSSMTTRALTSGTAIKKMEVKIPKSKKEQFQIGEFFTLLELKIKKQQEKIELLKEQKKGHMQKIFNRELRFKDENGKAYPEWKEYIFNDLFEPRNIKQVPDDDAPLMAFTSTDGIQDKGERYNREFLVKNKNKKYKKTFYNDIIYSSNNLDVGAIGRNKFGTVVISDVYEIFSVKERITPEFAEALITQKRVLHKILKYRQGALYGQYRIHATDFLKVTTFIPSFKEQVKISSFIKKIDNKINLEEKLLFQLNLKQKSFLQQMFV